MKPKTYSCKRGFLASADVQVESPQQANNQSVNVIVHNNLTQDKKIDIKPYSSNVEQYIDKEIKLEPPLEEAKTQDPIKSPSVFAPPLDDGVDMPPVDSRNGIKGRSVETAQDNLEEIKKLVKDKDALIEALGLIIDIYQHNPLIVNKYLVAQEDVLIHLISLLTNADEITLNKVDCSGGCLCKAVEEYSAITKILIKKGEQIYNFKYSFTNVIQLLDERNISWKFCY